MTFISLNKLNKACFKWTILALATSFSLLVLFGTPLHDHDMDPSHLDPDCIPCHLVHSIYALEIDTLELFLPTLGTQSIETISTVWIASAPLTAFSRAPPVIC